MSAIIASKRLLYHIAVAIHAVFSRVGQLKTPTVKAADRVLYHGFQYT